MTDSLKLLVTAFWRYHRLSQGDRAQRLEAEGDFWAWQEVEQAVDNRDADLVKLFDALLHDPDADPGYVGAGPIEDTLNERADLANAIAVRCRQDAVWGVAVRAAWLEPEVYDQLAVLHPWLPVPR